MYMGEVLSNGAISTSGSFYMVLSSSIQVPHAQLASRKVQGSAIFPTLFN
jgi:hypothetical protein